MGGPNSGRWPRGTRGHTTGRPGPWPKGVSGNPAGGPKKAESLTSILKTQLSQEIDTPTGRIELREAIVQKLIRLALGGDRSCLQYVFDRLDGRPEMTQTLLHDVLPRVRITGIDEPGDP